MPCIGIDSVAAESGLHELCGRVALGDGVLTGSHDGHACRALLGEHLLHLALHLVEGGVPADRDEIPLLVELAVFHPHQGPREPVLAIHDAAIEVALYAVETPVDRGIRVALGRYDAPVLCRDLDTAADAAEAADALVPAPALFGLQCQRLLCCCQRNAHGGGSGGRDGIAHELSAGDRHQISPRWVLVFCDD